MNETEAQKFIGDVLKGFFPAWETTNAEYKVWVRKLIAFDYNKAERALGDWLSEELFHGKAPKLGKVLKALFSRDAGIVIEKKLQPDIKATHYIECIEAPERNPKLIGRKRKVYAAELSRQGDPDYMLRIAEGMRGKYQDLYGGTWIIVQVEPEEPDSGLRGPQARDKAFADILNGPDNRTRRWLERYLKKQYPQNMRPDMQSVPPLEVPNRGMKVRE